MTFSLVHRTFLLGVVLPTLTACGESGPRSAEHSVASDLTASLLETAAPRASGATEGATPQSSEGVLDLTTLGYGFGSEDAPIQVIEFSDFGCGYCARFHAEVFPSLERDYIETGKVEWKYIPMILGIFGANAELAARAGECAGEQDRFATMRDRLFASQSEWKRARDPRAHFDAYAREQGLDLERFERCVDEDWRGERVAAGTRLSRQSGVRGTPTFFVVGYGTIPGMLPLDVFQQMLETVYADRIRGGSGP
jgi:protein-disulfide isomerase